MLLYSDKGIEFQHFQVFILSFETCFRFFWDDVYSMSDTAGYVIKLVNDIDVDVIFGSPQSKCKVHFHGNCLCLDEVLTA